MSLRRMPPAVAWLLTLAVSVVFFSLSGWQWSRAQQKQQLLAQAHQVLSQRHALALSQAGLGLDKDQPAYAWAAGTGHFLPGPAVLLDNQNWQGRAGVRVYRVFQASDGVRMLLELGWLPLPGDRRLPEIPVPAGQYRLAGLLLPPPSAGLLKRPGAAQPNGDWLVTHLDPVELAKDLNVSGLAPRVFRPDPALPLGYARDLDIMPNTLPPQRHLGYAVQWFGLGVAVWVVAWVVMRRRRRAH